MKVKKKEVHSRANYSILIIAAIVLWAAHLAALLLPDGRMWGLNHLLFLSPTYTYIYLIAGLAALGLLFRPLRDSLAGLYDSIADSLFGRRRIMLWSIISAIMLVIFWLIRIPANLLGEGYNLIRIINSNAPLQYKWYEAGAVKLIFGLAQLLPLGDVNRGEYTYALMSVLSGAVTLFFFFLLAFELVQDKMERLFIFGLLVFSGWTLLFLGYAETTPLIWPFMAAYLFFSTRYILGQGNLIVPTLILIAAVLLQLQTVFFLVSYPVLLMSRGFGLEAYRKYKIYLWSALAAAFAGGLVIFIIKYLGAIEFQLYFLPWFTGRPATPGYAVFSLIHLADILNEITLLIPIWPLLLILSRRRWRAALKDSVDIFLLSFILGGAVFLAIIDPTLGMGRAWDLLAISCLGPLLLLSRWAVTSDLSVRKIAPGLVILSLILILPFFVTNLKFKTHRDYAEWQLRLDQSRSKTGLVLLRGFYKDIKDYKAADSINLAIYKNFPVVALMDEAEEYLTTRKPQEALGVAQRIYEADPYSFEGYLMRGVARLHTGDLKNATADLEQAVSLAPWHAVALTHLGQAYEAADRHEMALASFRKAQEFNPNLTMTLEGLAMTFNALNNFDSSYIYATRVLKEDSTKMQICLLAGIAAVRLGDNVNAAIYLNRYINMNPPDYGRARAMDLLMMLH